MPVSMMNLRKLLLILNLCVGGLCCNSGWWQFEGKCYKASQNLYSVTMAKRYCQVSGGQLAHVNSVDVLRFISGIPGFDSGNEYWLSDDSALPEPTTISNEDDSLSAENTTLTPNPATLNICRYAKILKINTEYCEEKKYFVCESLYPDEPDICPKGFDHYGKNCYRAITAAPSNYEDANKYCALQKSKLAILEPEDDEWEAKLVLLGKKEIFLVGARKYDGVLKWSNGVLFNPIHDMFGNYSDGECIGFFSDPENPLVFSWAHLDCNKTSSFLCKTDVLPQKTTESTTTGAPTTTLPPLTCPHGYNWKSNVDSGYCFWETTYETDRLNWFQARDFCKAYGGDLASYGSAEQEKLGLGGAVGHYRGLWIGLKRDENNVFQWADGNPLNYSNWDYDEPNLQTQTKSCVSHSPGNSKWELDYCGVRRWFICKAPKLRVTIIPDHKQEEKKKCNITGASLYSTHWYLHENYCYLIQDKAEYTWDTARIFCQDNGGQLASIHSSQETDFILNIITGYPAANYWIGLEANAFENSFQWTDNSPLDFIYWTDNKDDIRNFTYCTDFDKRDGSWNVNHCSRYQGAICKRGVNATYNAATTEPTTTTIMPGNCEKGWFSFGNKCYNFFGTRWSQRASWEEAKTECSKIGASLVSIHNIDEQEFLSDLLLAAGTNVWIGMQTIERGTLFHWSDDSRVDFTNWKDNEPEFHTELNLYGVVPSLCVKMETEHFGKWNDVRCSDEYGYICQKMKDPTNTVPYEDPFICPNMTGWYKLGSTCYGIFNQHNLTWLEAQRECQTYKADLVSVKNAAASFFIKRKLKLKSSANPYFWIGVREKRPNNYEYVTSQHLNHDYVTRKHLSYDNWMAGQPKAASSYLDNCVSIQRDGRWLVRSCKERHPFICGVSLEGDSDSSEPELSINEGHMCSNLTGYWQYFGDTNCYMYELDLKLSWVDAMHYCFRHGGYLASFHSAEEVEKLMKLIVIPYTYAVPTLHIGLGMKKDGSYAWVDKSALDYTNWDAGEPLPASSRHWTTGCVDINLRNHKWRAMNCDQERRRGFICSAPKQLKTSVEEALTSNTTHNNEIIKNKLGIGGIFGIVICLVAIFTIIGVTVYYLKFSKEVQPRLMESDAL